MCEHCELQCYMSWYMNAVSSFPLIPVVLVGKGSNIVVKLLTKESSTGKVKAFWVRPFILGILSFFMFIASSAIAQRRMAFWMFGDITTMFDVLASLSA